MAGHSPVVMPTIPNVTVDSLRAGLGAEYAVESAGPTLVLARQVNPHEIVVIVEHNAEGGVELVSAQVVGPKGTDARSNELLGELIRAVGKAVGITDSQGLDADTDIVLAYMRADLPYSFELARLSFSSVPGAPLDPKSKHITYRADHVCRGIGVLPVPSGGAAKWRKIPGASLAQLNELLADFTVKASVPGEVVLYVREQPTHTDNIVCSLNKPDEITHIEAFASGFQGDVDPSKLSEALWAMLAGLVYKDCNPEKAAAFLLGPKLEYAAGDGRDIGAASYWVPVEKDGTRRRLTVFAADL